jgi:membrane-bound lytic murein transglycosylase D
VALPSRRHATRVLLGAALITGVAASTFIYGTKLFVFDDESPTEVASPLPDAMSNVLAPTESLTADDVRSGEPWTAADFSNQTNALGWTRSTFDIPEGLRKRVDFWKQIYSKYTTDQGVLHDPVTLDVYESVQFTPFKPGESLSISARAREKIVNAKRALVSERLLALQERLDQTGSKAVTTPFDPEPTDAKNPSLKLSGDDLRYWHFFESGNDPNKYRKAAARIRFQLGQKDKFLLGIFESGRYLKQMETIFRDEGLPIELTRLPFVESSFNTRARSKVGASGIWQFMRRTAKPYLKVNQSIDERDDPLAATHAAARLMKNNFGLARTWPLTVTAWNHGPSGVRNIVQKLGSDDISLIVNSYSSRTFGFASQNFYACFLAVLSVESHATSYFSNPVWQRPYEFIEVKTPSRPLAWPQVVKLFADDDALAQDYNPQITAFARVSKPRIPAGTKLRLPTEAQTEALLLFSEKKLAQLKPKQVKKPVARATEAKPAAEPTSGTNVVSSPTPAVDPTPTPTPAPAAEAKPTSAEP